MSSSHSWKTVTSKAYELKAGDSLLASTIVESLQLGVVVILLILHSNCKVLSSLSSAGSSRWFVLKVNPSQTNQT